MAYLNIEIPDELDQAFRAKIRDENKRELKKNDIRLTVIGLIKLYVGEK
jgi:hypothetical protein